MLSLFAYWSVDPIKLSLSKIALFRNARLMMFFYVMNADLIMLLTMMIGRDVQGEIPVKYFCPGRFNIYFRYIV